jgi:DNA-binding beta-propeller fold protein YncE
MDVAFGKDGKLYVLCRAEGLGNNLRVTNWDDEDLGTIGGTGDAELQWPVQVVTDAEGDFYISDEALHRVVVIRPDGAFVRRWGSSGSGEGQLNRPSGLAFDANQDLWVVDTLNHRLQRYSKDGKFISGFGQQGSGDGELNMPWGVAVDDDGNLLVADWRNDRIQKFTPDGRFVMKFGRSGHGDGELNRPAGIHVDEDGDVYVADRGNNRVQQFDWTGRFVATFTGDATLSKSGLRYIENNVVVLRAREMTELEPQKRLRGPASVRMGPDRMLYIPDFGSHRVQVYRKEAYRLGPDRIAPVPRAPSLYSV